MKQSLFFSRRNFRCRTRRCLGWLAQGLRVFLVVGIFGLTLGGLIACPTRKETPTNNEQMVPAPPPPPEQTNPAAPGVPPSSADDPNALPSNPSAIEGGTANK